MLVGLIRRTACARVQFSGCSSTTNAHSETGQMAVCCQNLPLGALSSRSAPSLLFGALFKKFCIFLNTGVYIYILIIFSVLDSEKRGHTLLNSLIMDTNASCRGANYLRQSYRHLKLLTIKRMRTVTQ
jgi:hypothetical protein